MCGKFTAKRRWTDFTDPRDLAEWIEKIGDDPLIHAEEDSVTYRVMNNLPVIVLDRVEHRRRVVPMRWGFPHPKDWKRPQPIHARAETIEITQAFADAFLDGQRGLVLMQNFNEAPDIEGPTQQHVISPAQHEVLAAAFVWRRFDSPGGPLFACCLVTVPANALIATLPTDRMPAFLSPGDWKKWLSEEAAGLDELKGCLKTVDGTKWTMRREELREKKPRGKSGVSNQGGLF